MKIVVITLSLLCSITSTSLFAGGKSKGKKYIIPWGMAGCGLGSLIVKEKGQLPQIAASFLNDWIVPQTSAITSGTSNCIEPSPAFATAEQEVYIESNLASLAKDASRGNGSYLHGMAEVFGCNNQASFAKITQENYGNIFSSNNARSVLDNYRTLILNTKGLAEDCSRVVHG